MVKSATLLGMVIFCALSATGQQKWENQLPFKSCSVKISANHIMASTYLEWEFYNPGSSEIECVKNFTLNDGQVITAFQLDLNGKFRDGTIEEKWKASNSYNAIVGKRIDPALLTMGYQNSYNLRIYPVPAKGTRKVSLTVQQLLLKENNRMVYRFPLQALSQIENFYLHIDAESTVMPGTEAGTLQESLFKQRGNLYQLDLSAKKKQHAQIAFSLPIEEKVFCSRKNNEFGFAFRKKFSGEAITETAPVKVQVFWDVSGNVQSRDIEKEISFLNNYLYYNRIKKVSFIPFNTKLLKPKLYDSTAIARNKWQRDIRSLDYDGAAQLGIITADSSAEAVNLIFSDGINTFGNSFPQTGTAKIYCINSAENADLESLKNICSPGGGSVIDLRKTKIPEAVYAAGKTEYSVLHVSSNKGILELNQKFPLQLSGDMVFSGTCSVIPDTLFVHIGTVNALKKIEKILIPPGADCNTVSLERFTMLAGFSEKIRTLNWYSMIEYGLKEKIVTPNTAYIVLERLEDYVRYNIEAPADLKEACEKINYVKRDTRFERYQLFSLNEQEMLINVAVEYNSMLKKRNPLSPVIDVEKLKASYRTAQGDRENGKTEEEPKTTKASVTIDKTVAPKNENNINEVVVTSAYGIRRQARSSGSNIQYISSAELGTIREANINNALAGKVAGLQVRSQSAGMLGAETTIRLRGENSILQGQGPIYVLDGGIVPNASDINTDDIEDISILQGPAAAALFGAEGANGAIVINSKKGRPRYYYNLPGKPYVLKNQEDVDYIQRMQAADKYDQKGLYKKLEELYSNEPGFYYDMAEHFYHSGDISFALNILMNASEAANGVPAAQEQVAAYLENWKYFDEAALIYSSLIKKDPLQLRYYRELAWINYEAGNIQHAVDILTKAILLNTGIHEEYNHWIKSTMLDDLNNIISVHKATLKLSEVPPFLLCNTSAGLKITVDWYNAYGECSVEEPAGGLLGYNTNNIRQNGILRNNYFNYNRYPAEYSALQAQKGIYKVSMRCYSQYYSIKVPASVKLRKIKLQNNRLLVETENIIIQNQYGEFEISEVEF